MFISYFEIDMILIYILSILSLSSLFVDKSVQVGPVEENNTLEVKTVSKPQKINSEKSQLDENNLQDMDIEAENFDISENDEEYEEIIFQDNFDKEYRSGTEDNYLEE